jgi:hypothetical protein
VGEQECPVCGADLSELREFAPAASESRFIILGARGSIRRLGIVTTVVGILWGLGGYILANQCTRSFIDQTGRSLCGEFGFGFGIDFWRETILIGMVVATLGAAISAFAS